MLFNAYFYINNTRIRKSTKPLKPLQLLSIIAFFSLPFHHQISATSPLRGPSTKIKDQKKGDQLLNKLNLVTGSSFVKGCFRNKPKIKMKFEKCQLQHTHLCPSSPMIMELGDNWENCSCYCKKEYSLGISCKQIPHSYRRYHRTVVLISMLTASGAARDFRGSRSLWCSSFQAPFYALSTRSLNLTHAHSSLPRQKATVYMATLTYGWHYRWAWMARIWFIFKQCNISLRGVGYSNHKSSGQGIFILIPRKENSWL